MSAPALTAAPNHRGATLLLYAAIALAVLALAGTTLTHQLRQLVRAGELSHGGRA